jgi:hypothetical protein
MDVAAVGTCWSPASSELRHASHKLFGWTVSKAQIYRVSSFRGMQHGPSDASRFVGRLQGMTHHRFPIAFASCIGRRCYQEKKETAFVDDCRCSLHWFVTFVGDKPIRVLLPECGLFHNGEARLNRNAI